MNKWKLCDIESEFKYDICISSQISQINCEICNILLGFIKIKI